MPNDQTPVSSDATLKLFEAAVVAALRAGHTIDDLTPWLLRAIDTVAEAADEPPER